MNDALPKFPAFPAPRSSSVWAAPMPLPARGGSGLGVRVDEQGMLVTLQPREEKIERYALDERVAGGSFKGCWFPSAIDSTHIQLTGGSFTCGSIFTPSVSSVAVDASALTYVYLRATLSATTVDGYVTGGVATAATVLGSTTTLTSDNTYGYILLCTWQAGALVDRYEYFSLKARLNNSGVGDVYFEHGMA